MNIGRNDFCICGSKKKYKKCCMNKDIFDTWKDNSYSILEKSDFSDEQKDKLIKTFFTVLNDIRKNNVEGSCHQSSSILYVLLNEYGFAPSLCIGEVLSKKSGLIFDHSWIEIDKMIFDAAIFLPLNKETADNVVFYGDDIGTKEPSLAVYGYGKGELDVVARQVYEYNFNEYMDGYPLYKGGLWSLVRDFSIKIGDPLDLGLKEKYDKTKRNLISNNI